MWIKTLNLLNPKHVLTINFHKLFPKQTFTLHSGLCQVMLSCSLQWTNPGRTSWGEWRTGGMPSKPPPPQVPWKRWPPVDRTWRKYRRAWRFVCRSLKLYFFYLVLLQKLECFWNWNFTCFNRTLIFFFSFFLYFGKQKDFYMAIVP